MTKRPLIPTDVRAHLGEERESEAFAQANDWTYTPGYSDKRREFEAAIARGEKPSPLPFRLQLVRVKNSQGSPDGTATAGWRAKGYRELMASDMERLGIGMPVGGQTSADGFIDVGDTRMFICDGRRAAQNQKNWRRATDEAQATNRAPDLERETAKYAKPGETLWSAEGSYSDAKEGDQD